MNDLNNGNRLAIVKKWYWAYAVMLLCMAVLVYSTYTNSTKQSSVVERNLHTYKVIGEADDLLTSLVNMQSGVRGFSLTGSERVLQPYHSGKSEFAAHMAAALKFTQDNSGQQQRLLHLQQLEQQWEDIAIRQIALRREVNDKQATMDDIVAFIQKEQGEQKINVMRFILAEAIKEERWLLQQRSLELQKSEQDEKLINSGLSAATIVLAGLFGVAAFIEIRQRKKAAAALTAVNAGLEEKVEMRTRELQDINSALEEEIMERQAAQQALQDFNARLEGKVAARTRELEDINTILEEEIMERQAAQMELENLNSSLEEKVEARTRELQDINAALEEEVMERQAAQEALQEDKERYEALLRQSVEAVAIIDLQSGTILEANEAFLRMFGYSAAQIENLSVFAVGLLTEQEFKSITGIFENGGKLEPLINYYQFQAQRSVQAERTGSFIRYRGKNLLMLSYHDVTEERKLQATLHEQVLLAAEVQKSMLPREYHSENCSIRTIFEPVTLVSGDFFGYYWSPDGGRLNGYVMDVTGHGVATALYSSAVSSLVNEVVSDGQGWSEEKVAWINERLAEYLNDNTFVALIAFSFDFKQQQLTCISGGINYLLASSGSQNGIVGVPGIYLGVTNTPRFGSLTIPIQNGDCFYFMTDGIYERLPPGVVDHVYDFADTVAALEHVAASKTDDDCSAVCIQIFGLRSQPAVFELKQQEDRQCIRYRISQVLGQLAGKERPRIEVALGEAIANAVRNGSDVHIKINKIGNRLILRIRGGGNGFNGNELVKRYTEEGISKIFARIIDQECGRGIPIMMMWMDRVVYNRLGTEVMLVKRVAKV